MFPRRAAVNGFRQSPQARVAAARVVLCAVAGPHDPRPCPFDRSDETLPPAPPAGGVHAETVEEVLDHLAEVRLPETERDAAIHRLQAACVAGQLTLGEFGRRVEAAFSARSNQELDRLTTDLPAAPAPAARDAGLPAASGQGGRAHVSLSLLGSHHQSGRWTLPAKLVYISVLGGAEWDLAGALMPQPVTTITVISLLGSIDVRIPDHVDAEVGGFSLLGGHHVDLGEVSPPADAPLIRVRHFSLLGSVRLLRGQPSRTGLTPPAFADVSDWRELRHAERWRRRAERRRRRLRNW